MSVAPPGYEFLEAQFAEIARQLLEQARHERIQASPWAYGDKINLAAGAGGFTGVLPETLGGTGGTSGAGNIDAILVDDDGNIVIDDDGNVATE